MNPNHWFRSPRQTWAICLVPILSLSAYISIKSAGFHWYLADENIYYYLSKVLSWQNLPYQDFFYANPPVLLGLLKISGILSGWTVIGLHSVPILASCIAGITLFSILYSRICLFGLIPMWAYWMTYDALRASTHATGINVTLAFIVLAYLLAFRDRPLAASFFLGLALWTKFYAVTAIPGVALVVWMVPLREKRIRNLGKFILVTTILIGLLALFGTLIGGMSFWQMNFAYHLAKDVRPEGNWPKFQEVAKQNIDVLILVVITALYSIACLRFKSSSALGNQRAEDKVPNRFLTGNAPDLLIASLVHLGTVTLFLVLQKKLFDFYFLLYMPGIALLMGALLVPVHKAFQAVTSQETRIRRLSFTVLYLLAATLLLVQPVLPRRISLGEKVVSPKLFNKDVVSYQEHEARHYDELAKLANILKDASPTVLSGDSGTAPTIALLSESRLAGDEADTNIMRFQTGFPSPAKFIQHLESEDTEWLVVRGKRKKKGFSPAGMFALKEFSSYANTEFEIREKVDFEREVTVMLMKRKSKPTARSENGNGGYTDP